MLLATSSQVSTRLFYSVGFPDKCYTDPEKWPYGIRNFTASLRAKKITASAYSDNGYKTCAGYPGSYGYELQDLTTWIEWGFDYLKYDNCYIPFDNITSENEYGRYKRMADAIAKKAEETGNKPFEYSLCEWGWSNLGYGEGVSHNHGESMETLSHFGLPSQASSTRQALTIGLRISTGAMIWIY